MSSIYSRVIELAKAHTAPPDIAMRLGLSMNAVYQHLHKARSNGEDIPQFQSYTSKGRNGDHAFVPDDTRELLMVAAQKRRISTTFLASKIIQAVAQGDLVDAVLDDGVKSDG